MQSVFRTFALALLAASLFPAASLQAMLPASMGAQQDNGGMGGNFQDHSVRGSITAISGSTLTVKSDVGDIYSVATGANTRFRKGHDRIQITDLHVGDMIAAIGDKDAKARTLGAAFVMVIDRDQYEKARADFGKTWTMGVVQSINGTNITIKRPDNATQVIAVDENTSFRKRRQDITLPDIKVGDTVNARGAIKDGNFLATEVNVSGPGGGFAPGHPDANNNAPQN